jgi:hypothetical protein
MANIPLINGVAYSWADISFNIFGVEISGVDAISYSDEQAITDNYGAGRNPVSRSYGQITYEASITLHMEEVIALQNASPTGRLQDLPEVDIPVVFLPENGVISTDVLKNVKFTKNTREVSKGDDMVAVEIPLRISHIIWHKAV